MDRVEDKTTIVKNRKKLVVIGDYSGKTCAVRTFVEDRFCPALTTITYDRFITDIEANGQCLEVDIWDTTSGHKMHRLRVRAYPGTDAFLIFFSVYNRESFENVKEKWLPEMKEHCRNAPYVLVGTLGILGFTSSLSDRISSEEGEALAKEIGARCYVECLTDRKYNLEKVFVEGAAAALERDDQHEDGRGNGFWRNAMKTLFGS